MYLIINGLATSYTQHSNKLDDLKSVTAILLSLLFFSLCIRKIRKEKRGRTVPKVTHCNLSFNWRSVIHTKYTKGYSYSDDVHCTVLCTYL